MGIVTASLLFAVGCSSSTHTVDTTSTARANPTSSGAPTTTAGSRIADLLLSACVLHQTPAEVRAELAELVAPAKVQLFLDQFNAMDC